MIADHRVSVFYTAPTAIRSLIKANDVNPATAPRNYDLASLRLLGSVGEPINPEAWMWYYRNVGRERCPVVDTWWQTETGGHMIRVSRRWCRGPARCRCRGSWRRSLTKRDTTFPMATAACS